MTKYELSVTFHQFPARYPWYWVIKALTCSRHVHAQIELWNPRLTVDPDKTTILSTTLGSEVRFHTHEAWIKHWKGKTKYMTVCLGQVELTSEDFEWIQDWKPTTKFGLIWHQLVGRFIGQKPPNSCVTFVTEFLQRKVPDKVPHCPRLFAPKDLYYLLTGER